MVKLGLLWVLLVFSVFLCCVLCGVLLLMVVC